MYRKNHEVIILNLIPIIGYWFLNWNMFSILYIYWFEAVIVAFFYALKKSLALGREPVEKQPAVFKRIVGSLKLLVLRWMIMAFYWVFIVVFVALGQGKMGKAETFQNMKILLLHNRGFNLAILFFFLNGVLQLWRDFYLNKTYKTALYSDYKALFDARTIILHIVIVVGTFAYQYLGKFSEYDNRLPGLGFVIILCILKTIADLLLGSKSKPAFNVVEMGDNKK